MFRRGEIVTDRDNGLTLMILGPQDFDGYNRNRPNDSWELVSYPDGEHLWIGNNKIVKKYKGITYRRLSV